MSLFFKFGVRKILIFLGFITVLGQAIVVIGCFHHSFAIMFIGRVIFGYGSESCTAAQNVYITYFFQEENLAFPISMGNAIALLGTYMNYILTAEIAKKSGLNSGFLTGFFFCCFSLLATFIAILIDQLIEKWLEKKDLGSIEENEKEESTILIKKDNDLVIFQQNSAFLKKIPLSFWPLLFCSVIIYASSIGFNSIAVSYFVEKWFPNLDVKNAEIASSKVISLDSFTNIISSLFLAIIMHYANGILHIFNTVNALISLISFSLFLFTIYPLVPLVLDGIASSLNYNIINTLIPIMVEEKYMGVAYGMSVAGNNLGTSLTPLITAFLRNCYNNYDLAIVFFIVINLIGLISAVMFFFKYQEEFIKRKAKNVDDNI